MEGTGTGIERGAGRGTRGGDCDEDKAEACERKCAERHYHNGNQMESIRNQMEKLLITK